MLSNFQQFCRFGICQFLKIDVKQFTIWLSKCQHSNAALLTMLTWLFQSGVWFLVNHKYAAIIV